MQIRHIGYGIKGFRRVAKLCYLSDMMTKEAKERVKILDFFDKYGLSATKEAFGVSERTLYRWKAALKAAKEDSGP